MQDQNSNPQQGMQQAPQVQLLQVIQSTPPAAIADLDFVREKYINNYNACHAQKVGELMYHRQVIHFKQQIMNSDGLRKCDPFSLYACFLTASAKGYSFDPQDDEVYLLPRGGKAIMQRQAGVHVRRLKETNQIVFADQAKLVYQGDIFQVENGRVLRHVENFQSDIIIAGYIRFQLDSNGADRFIIYRKNDWESWRAKSDMKNGANWNTNGQPLPGFLRTKIVLHATKEKCWATGSTPPTVEMYAGIEEDADETPDSYSLPEPPAGAQYQATMIVSQAVPQPTPQAHEPQQGQQLAQQDDPALAF